MTPQQTRPDTPRVETSGVVDLLIRAVEGLYEGVMPGARLEALIDRLETPT
jgi:hypothetical protein